MAEDALDVGCGATSLALQCAAAQGIIAGRVTTFGRVPLFYYIVHIYLLHASAISFAWITRGGAFFCGQAQRLWPWAGRNLCSVASDDHIALAALCLVCCDQAAAYRMVVELSLTVAEKQNFRNTREEIGR
jgi:hypothetical protein